MRNIKLVLEYDGASFYGFQKQPKHATVQQVLEKALTTFFSKSMKIQAASGRTDTGVHATCQVVNFQVATQRSLNQIQKGLNGLLPKSVVVHGIEEVPEDFHARYGAKSKAYEYRVWNSKIRSPLKASNAWHVTYPLKLVAIREGMKILKGRHDFKSFCAAKSSVKTTIRTIQKFQVTREGNLLVFRVQADGFLYNMVRILIGTLVEVGRGEMTAKDLKKVLLAKDRKLASRTAPAHGLTLVDVSY